MLRVHYTAIYIPAFSQNVRVGPENAAALMWPLSGTSRERFVPSDAYRAELILDPLDFKLGTQMEWQ